ncbi:helix-turn-helix domain-containing protein [Chryseobacterium viscerum]|uniref:helix-turn-helix domain-containing protein n=1 Tax=Chryseobacterium TaxID=59732 RepID=UPI0022228B70|nr:helix-turn-helix domain-containing protein [Chryseobacterium viscerum]MCW1961702.1 helix-turn-helix domain-containing protein [Chryseobacterium viscerum]WPO92851.1 helix-turn-helix domain-containing protein [Chryseobacterium sp. HR92]
MQKTESPDYKRIYEDILRLKHPTKKEQCESILSKSRFSVKDVITINDIIFPKADKKTEFDNQRHRSYDESTILEILDYQKNNRLNNSELARRFKLSRNTVAKWRRHFLL